SGKKGLFYGEDLEQVSRVSVHCKLGTRATQNNAYRRRRGGVKFKMLSMTLRIPRLCAEFTLSLLGDLPLRCVVYTCIV
ncbi:MAG TPA: hypothetical protein DIT97_02960, partial [Gimesia maris]|nr:hypothetical protein [Gimesia maris]